MFVTNYLGSRMEIKVELLEGQKLKAKFGKHEVISDQNISLDQLGDYPEPYDYFLVSMVLCAAFYVRQFCASRDIPTKGLILSQENSRSEEDKYKQTFNIVVKLPDNFPQKYRKAVLAAASSCTVKKVIQALPEFEVSIS